MQTLGENAVSAVDKTTEGARLQRGKVRKNFFAWHRNLDLGVAFLGVGVGKLKKIIL